MNLSESWLLELVSSWGKELLAVQLPFGGTYYITRKLYLRNPGSPRVPLKNNMNAMMNNLKSSKDPTELAGQY